MTPVECPRCRQGLLEKIVATKYAITMAKCDECDALYPAGGPVRADNFVQYQDLLAILGEEEMDSPLRVLGKVDST